MKHEIKTVEDILNVVDEKNIDNFLVDLKNWIVMHQTIELMSKLTGGETFTKRDIFNWIDDGKNNVEFTIKLEGK